uniref:Tf2-1-like SH3-like domain-containing protein n=2 Tax=Nicotiana TaxID=4085 RepID=A0A1S4ALM7_TOBAC
MALYYSLYGRRCRSLVGWFEPREARLLSTTMVRDAPENVKLIQESLHMVESRQKSYADRKDRDVAFMVSEKVILRYFSMKGVLRFGKKDKLIPRYLDPFKVLLRVGEVAYRHALPPILLGVHSVFHVFIIRKYYEDQSHVLDFSSVQLDENLAHKEESMAIFNRQ